MLGKSVLEMCARRDAGSIQIGSVCSSGTSAQRVDSYCMRRVFDVCVDAV